MCYYYFIVYLYSGERAALEVLLLKRTAIRQDRKVSLCVFLFDSVEKTMYCCTAIECGEDTVDRTLEH